MNAFNRAVAGMLVVACAGAVQTQAYGAETFDDQKSKLDAQIELVRKQRELNQELRQSAGAAVIGLPTIISISRFGGQRVARLQMPGGSADYYREGEPIRQGMTVSVITAKQVIVSIRNGKNEVALPLEYAAAPAMPGMAGAAGAAGSNGATNVPNELLPQAPNVSVPAIEVVPRQQAAAGKGK
jgi:hypothetical protein